MATFRRPEYAGRINFRDYIQSLFGKLVDQTPGNFPLRFIREENSRSILAALIAAINRGVVYFEEITGELFERSALRIESHLHCFGVAGVLGTYLPVSGVFFMTAHKPNPGEKNALLPPEEVFLTPKAAGGKVGYFSASSWAFFFSHSSFFTNLIEREFTQ